MDGGSGHSGKRAPTLHFGLGRLAADTPMRVDLRWRDAGGSLRDRTLWLTPGWHRIMLDAAAGTAAIDGNSSRPSPRQSQGPRPSQGPSQRPSPRPATAGGT